MSWSASVQIPKGTSYVDAAKKIMEMVPVGQDIDEARAAASVARNAAQNILHSGIVTGNGIYGNENPPIEHGVSISISGHANPGHSPFPGYGNDYVSVNMYQLTDPVDEAKT